VLLVRLEDVAVGVEVAAEDADPRPEVSFDSRENQRLTRTLDRSTDCECGRRANQMCPFIRRPIPTSSSPLAARNVDCPPPARPSATLAPTTSNWYVPNSRLQAMVVGGHACPLDSMADMHFCAAQGRDHTDCCV
ncbi:hypothetical protein PFISCL1PPCAC_12600, partial [Pristionchus fissidentatus]